MQYFTFISLNDYINNHNDRNNNKNEGLGLARSYVRVGDFLYL